MYQISDNDGPFMTLDSLHQAFKLAYAGSSHAPVYVRNMETNVEVTMYQRAIVGDNLPTHHHGAGIGPVCTILNCGE